MVDCDIPDVHYLLEITEKGFELHECLSRLMAFKRDNECVVSWMKYLGTINEP